MNRKLITIIIVLILPLNLFSQNIRFSVFVDPLINWFKSDVKTTKTSSAYLGINVGLCMDKYFAENYAITTGVSIGSYGGKLSHTYETSYSLPDTSVKVPANSAIKYKLQYITIPIGLKFTTKEIGYSRFYAHLGFSPQMNIKAMASNESSAVILDNDNIIKEMHFFNIGYFFGGGIMYSLGGNTAVIFGLTYTNGFVDITKNTKDRVTTNNVAVRVGIQF